MRDTIHENVRTAPSVQPQSIANGATINGVEVDRLAGGGPFDALAIEFHAPATILTSITVKLQERENTSGADSTMTDVAGSTVIYLAGAPNDGQIGLISDVRQVTKRRVRAVVTNNHSAAQICGASVLLTSAREQPVTQPITPTVVAD